MSKNVFADIGIPDPEEHLIKAAIVKEIDSLIDRKKLTQKQVGEIFKLSQPKVSELLNGQFRGYSVGRLVKFVNALNRDVVIVIDNHDSEGQGKTTVMQAA